MVLPLLIGGGMAKYIVIGETGESWPSVYDNHLLCDNNE